MIHRWLKVPDNQDMLSRGLSSKETIVADTEACIGRGHALAESCFAGFIEIFQLPERPVLLGSDHAKPPGGGRGRGRP
ncbi:MAG: hypothetical protein HC902_13920 [Calothrix sp. SM1_5_4]|nr:hypothetical protein [Calothrix sp. SM1_5_4]